MPREATPPATAFLLAQVGMHASVRFGARVQALGLSHPQSSILGLLTANPGVSQQELARLLGMLPSRVVALVDEMEEAGVIRRQRDAADRRRNTLVLTASGKALVQKVATVRRTHEDDICSVLNAGERRQLAALLGRIAEQQGLPHVVPQPASTRR